MKHTSALSENSPRIALLSVQPIYVERIVAGQKLLEFRRRWTSMPVDHLVIYSSSPVQRIVLTARVVKVLEGSPSWLWKLAKSKGGGVTRRELYEYFSGLAKGFAIELGDVLSFKEGLDPRDLFRRFRAPQSFKYLLPREFRQIMSYELM
jgi:predicted transcriptional regulator